MESETVINAVIALCEAFGRAASEPLVRGYALGLEGLSDDQIKRAVVVALRQCRFMPVPAELRELAISGGGTFATMAERAFHALSEAVRRHGADYSVNFQDGLINAVLRLHGGWIRICNLPREEFEKWYRKDFVATYAHLCHSGASEEQRRYHGGRLERDNAHWQGLALPNGRTFQRGDFGTGVISIVADYHPALPSPEPRQRSLITQGLPIELKVIA